MTEEQLNPKILGQLLLMQSYVINLPDRKSIFSFVCKGLMDIPGISKVNYVENSPKEIGNPTLQESFPVLLGNSYFGELVLTISDTELYKPYKDYLANFIFMVGVVLEERNQRQINEQNQLLLEQRIAERTIELKEKAEEIEAQNEEYCQINEELALAKEKSEENEINLLTILSSTTDIIASYDLNIRLITYNKACIDIYRNLFGIEIYPGLCTLDLFPETMRNFWTYHNSRAIAGETFSIEINVPTPNGELIFEQFYNPIFKDGKVVCFSTFTRDITEKKRIETELIAAKEHAEESDRLKTAFLQNMSHEIRTPLNAIMGFSDLLEKNFDNKAKLQKFSEIIGQRSNDLLDIINDILDIAKIESGQVSVNIEQCNLGSLCEELISFFNEYQNRIGKQHIKFCFHVGCEVSGNLILVDKVKLKQILINLISNAFKFTDEGVIDVGCNLHKDQNLLFYVSDSGIGIPADKHQVVFERFSQIHQGSKYNVGGTGLGLTITKALVNMLGGEIFLESEPGKGSTFSFTIPYKIPQLIHQPQLVTGNQEKKSFSNKTILIVEDDQYNAEYVKEILSGKNVNILVTENGQEAIEISLSQPVDIVLMDIRLPGINGYEVIHQIKQHKPNLKIIAQTAYAAQDEKQKAFDAGCNDYISKPIKQEVLLTMLSKHL